MAISTLHLALKPPNQVVHGNLLCIQTETDLPTAQCPILHFLLLIRDIRKVIERHHQNPELDDIKKNLQKSTLAFNGGECSKLILVVIEFHLVFPFS
jgi:hypothetical protein